MPDYVYAVETDDHVNIREAASTSSSIVGELLAGTRLQAAEAIKGDPYGGSGAGDMWYPVLFEGFDRFVAAGYSHIV